MIKRSKGQSRRARRRKLAAQNIHNTHAARLPIGILPVNSQAMSVAPGDLDLGNTTLHSSAEAPSGTSDPSFSADDYNLGDSDTSLEIRRARSREFTRVLAHCTAIRKARRDSPADKTSSSCGSSAETSTTPTVLSSPVKTLETRLASNSPEPETSTTQPPHSNSLPPEMQGFGPSFGARVRAAELDAANAAKARSSDLQNTGAAQPVPSSKPLSAEAPHYTPSAMAPRRPMHRAPQRPTSRGLSNSNHPRAIHPLRNVTTIYPSNENPTFVFTQHPHQFYPPPLNQPQPVFNFPQPQMTFNFQQLEQQIMIQQHHNGVNFQHPHTETNFQQHHNGFNFQHPQTETQFHSPQTELTSHQPQQQVINFQQTQTEFHFSQPHTGNNSQQQQPEVKYPQPQQAITFHGTARRDTPTPKPAAPTTTSNQPEGYRIFGPDDLSPTKMEEKTAERLRLFKDAPGNSDPFVSTATDTSDSSVNEPYHINLPPRPTEHNREHHLAGIVFGQFPGHHHIERPMPPPNVSSNNGHGDVRGVVYGNSGHSLRESLERTQTHAPGVNEASPSRHAASTPHHSAAASLANSSAFPYMSTPQRSILAANTEQRQATGPVGHYIGESPERSLETFGHANARGSISMSHASFAGSSHRSVHGDSPEAYMARQRAPVGTRLQIAYPEINTDNPLLQPNFPGSIQQPPLLGANMTYPGMHPSGRPLQPFHNGPFLGMNQVQRPVPWAVAPAGTNTERQSTRMPPPGLPIPNPLDRNIMCPYIEDLPDFPFDVIGVARPGPSESEREGEDQLRERIAELAHEEAVRRVRLGGNEHTARRAAEMNLLLGNVLVNLQSYVVGDRDSQAANFANFGDIPPQANVPSNGGSRSYFSVDPTVDRFALPPRPRPGLNSPIAEEEEEE